jgi:D-galactose 1-dehydrogenase/L-arabinose 1- dehydrogenase
MKTLRLGLVGLGKIARDQHLPAIAGTDGAELVAVASRNAQAEGVANYPDLEAMLAGEPDLDAIIMCQPPQVRFEAAWRALSAGKHVFLEKPPGATVSEVDALVAFADAKRVTLFASWHARFAPAVAQARDWLKDLQLRRVSITWEEDVRHWHPGQTWIWEPGGFGVFDPGINALSILTEIVHDPILRASAKLEVPSNRQAPIAASLSMRTAAGVPIEADFDWRQTGPQTWTIEVTTEGGGMILTEGGSALTIDGVPQPGTGEQEYPAMYRYFVDLVRSGRSDADARPLRLVADAFLRARAVAVGPFED